MVLFAQLQQSAAVDEHTDRQYVEYISSSRGLLGPNHYNYKRRYSTYRQLPYELGLKIFTTVLHHTFTTPHNEQR